MPERPPAAPSPWTDARIAAALATLRDDLLVPDAPLDVAAATVVADEPRRRRPELVAAAIVAVALVIALAVAPAREAVADWLGIGSTEVRIDPERGEPDGSLPAIEDGARPVDADGARRALGRDLPPLQHPDTESPPQLAVPIEGGVLVRWAGRTETLWIHDAGPEPIDYLKKFATDDADIHFVDGLGEQALWLGGAHVLDTPGRVIAARNVLLWLDDGLELRLEGDLDRAAMIALAHGLGSE
jgi:hypothetical protein